MGVSSAFVGMVIVKRDMIIWNVSYFSPQVYD